MPRWAQYLMFISIMTAIYGGVHYYLYRRLIAALRPESRRVRRALAAAAVLLALSFPGTRMLVAWRLNAVTEVLDMAASVWMGLLLYLLLLTAAAHLIGVVVRRLGGAPPRLQGRERLGVAVVVALSVAIGGFGYWTARWNVRTSELTVPVKKLPQQLENFKVVLVSDIHLGAIVHLSRLRHFVEHINALEPDLVLIAGDLVDQDARHMENLVEGLKAIRSRHGVFAAPGNHDFYAGVDQVMHYASLGGVRFLRNEGTTVAGALRLYGVDDPAARRFPGYRRVPMEQVIGNEAKELPTLLMHHQPVDFDRAAALGVDLMVSGHTHGGQLWPFRLFSTMAYPNQIGLYQRGESRLYVSRGLGTWGPPMRIGSPPEVVRIRLTRS